MVLRRVSLVLALVVACVAPARNAWAGDDVTATPHVAHVGDRVCLVYRRPDGYTVVRCRPEHGTWAQAKTIDPTSLGLRLHAPADPGARAAVAGGAEDVLFGTALTLVDAGVLSMVVAPALPCRSLLPDYCASLDTWGIGLLTVGLAEAFLTVDAIVRGVWVLRTGSIAPSPAAHHFWTERILYGVGLLLVDVGAVVGGLAFEKPYHAQFDAGLILCGAGAVLLTADAVYRIYWDVDATGFTVSQAH